MGVAAARIPAQGARNGLLVAGSAAQDVALDLVRRAHVEELVLAVGLFHAKEYDLSRSATLLRLEPVAILSGQFLAQVSIGA